MQNTIPEQVFPFPWRLKLALLGVFALLLGWECIQKLHNFFLLIFSLGILLRAVAECRRKIVISEGGAVYWPSIGSPQRAVFAEVESIEWGKANDLFITAVTTVNAANFKLFSGVTFSFPLGMPDDKQVFDEIVRYWKMSRGDAPKTR